MEIKSFFGKIVDFTLKRLAETVGLLLVIISILLFLSLISYSPEDPNFIFPENTEINNILGLKGSFTSDIFYQSIGLISILVPFTIFFTGINIFRNKSFLKIIENIFFIIIYSILGSLFFSIFHEKSFWLTINGNNGFVGNLFEDSFLIKLIFLNKQIGYYVLLILISITFLLSINFSLKSFILFIKKILSFFKRKKILLVHLMKILMKILSHTKIITKQEFKKISLLEIKIMKKENTNLNYHLKIF